MTNATENAASVLSASEKALAIWGDVHNVLTQIKAMAYFTVNGGPTNDEDLNMVYAGLCSSVQAWAEKLSAAELTLEELASAPTRKEATHE